MPTPPPTPPYDTDQTGTTGSDNYPGTPGRDRYVGLDGADNLRGGDGNDVLIGDGGDDFIQGQNGDDYLEGGDGIDNLRGGNGDDTILGGAGDDLIRGGAGVDIIDGGDGNDRISFFDFDATQGVVADLATQTMANDGYGNSETFTSIEGLGSGTRFVDTLLGSDGANILLGNAEDTISGRGGDDLIQIGASATGGGTFDGGDGIDTLNFIDGYLADTNGDGIAEVVPTTVGVTVNLTAPTNQIQSDGNGRQATILNIENLGGTAFNDRLIGNAGNNTLTGNLGNDVLVGLGGNNILQGGLGSDVLVDLLAGTNDVLDGGEETDPAIIDLDYVSYFDPNLGSTGVTVSLALQGVAQTTGRGNDTLIGIEGLAGTRFADVLTGDDFNNALFGMGGADTIDAAGGNDAVVVSGFGSVIDGGAGNDVIAFWTTVFTAIPNEIPGGVTYDLSLGGPQASAGGTLTISNVENISGSRANDVFTGTAGDNSIGGSYGSDTLNGGDGNDSLYGDGTFSFNAATGEVSYIDEVIAPPGQPAYGIAAGDDVLNGGAGDDELFGGAGDDTLTGGAGFDTVFGGDGDDEYHFNIATDDVDQVNLEGGSDVAFITGNGNQTRITFSIGQAANGSPVDTITGPAYDGGLGLRVQAEDAAGNLVGGVSRFDDEGMTLATADGSTSFDIRILESGQTLGVFGALSIGTVGDDVINLSAYSAGAAILGGAGNDNLTGTSGNDYIQSGVGFDTLTGGDGNDVLVDVGGGNKVIDGGAGQDRFFFSIMANGANTIDLGDSSGSTGIDIVNIQGPSTIPQIRLTLDVAAAGNGVKTRGDGSLAVEIQREDANGNLIGAISRGDDEHILYNSPVGSVGFDIRDSVSGEFLGLYSFAYLGSAGADIDTALSPTRSYFYSLGGGDDQVNGGQLSDYMDGGIGNDVLAGGLGNDKLLGRDGDDLLTGGEGNDTIDGGAGADVAVFAKASSSYAVVSDGAGGFLVIDRETLEQDVVTNVETLRFSDGDFTPASIALNRIVVNPAGSPNANGSPNGDYILGDERTNVLNGQGGNDFVDGRGNPSPGQQLIRGQAGNDTLVGGEGDDQLRGGQGVDRFFGGNGFDRVSLFEVDATQAVSANLITQTINNDGFGNVEQMSSIEALGAGTRFADTFIGNDVRNLFLGDSSDTITANGGDDDIQLSGSTAGGGVVDGGDGIDFITFFTSDKQEDTNGDGIADSVTATVGVTIDLSQNRILNDGFGNTATLINVEGVTGGGLADTLTGNDGDNRFGMTLGSDVIDGRGGIDVLDTNNGARAKYSVVATAIGFDIVFTDTVFVFNPTTGTSDPQTVTATTSVVNVERIRFAEGEFNLADVAAPSTAPTVGNDTITGTTGADVINALAGNDVINGLAGDDVIDGGDGTDIAVFAKASSLYGVVADGAGFLVIDRETLEIDRVTNVETLRFSDGDFAPAAIALSLITVPAAPGSSNVNGNNLSNFIRGDGRTNLINAGGGNDIVFAGDNPSTGNLVDNIRGGTGDDVLVGEAGNDLLRGNEGVDRFFGGDGEDRISFFEVTATQGVVADLNTGIISNDGFGNVEYFFSIEGLGGATRFVDTFIGNGLSNLLLADSADLVSGNGGDDRFQLQGSVTGGGIFDGGDGYDIIIFFSDDRQEDTNGDGIADTVFATRGVTIDLALGRILDDGFGNTATLISIEGIAGTRLADVLLGDNGDNLIALSNGADVIDGRGGIDTITVEGVASTQVTITRTGQFSYNINDQAFVPAGQNFANANVTNVERIRFSNGEFALADLAPASTTASEGYDELTGTAGNDIINALGGDDLITGGGGNDQIDGGAGSDTAVFAKASTSYAVVAEGAGFLVIDRETLEQDFVVNVETLRFSNGDFTPASVALNRINLPAGTTNDGRNGTPAGDYIVGNDGYNVINGQNGDDFILAGGNGGAEPSVDQIRGNNGNDTLVGGAGSDLFRGGAGVDRFFGQGGNDRISFFEATATQGVIADLETGTISNDGFGNVEYFSSIEGLGGSTRFVDVFRGDSGNNLFLADTADTVEGRGGDDRFQLSGSVGGGGVIDGGDGFDVLYALTADRQEDTNGDGVSDTVAATQGVTIDLALGRILNDGFGNSATLISIEGIGGGNLNDTLLGSAGNDQFSLSNGNDFYDGRDGTDTLSVEGAASTDFVVTRIGVNSYRITDTTGVNAVLQNIEFARFTNGTFALSALNAGPGAGDDYVEGTTGNDTLNGLGGNDTIEGLAGDDTLSGGDGDDVINGGIGLDTIDGGAGSDTLNGGDQNDTITAGNGADTVNGGNGNDVVITGDSDGAADSYNGGNGSDTISYRTNTAGVTVNLALQGSAQNTGSEGMDTLNAFENLEGGSGNDVLTGNNLPNRINGLGGDDILSGGSFVNPTGGLSPNLLDGGDGYDIAVFAGNRADYEFQYIPATGRLNVIPLALGVSDGLLNIEAVRFDDGTFLVSQLNAIPTEGDDLINGTRFTDTIDGLGGNDTINGRAAPDTLNGGEGNDTLNGGDDNDTLDGGNGDDTVNGDAGNDTATGGAGTDTVNGGAGDDTLDGGAGNDIVRGGDGNDTITDGTGGSGNQLFGDAGDDVITTTGGLNTINGGTGNDTVNGGNGTDVITHDLLTGGSDRYNTGGGFDFVTLTMAAGSEARITFTSSEVGNGSATDSGTLANQDGDLAVRIQLEGNSGGLTGPVSRGDDEGVFYTASEGSTIEIRDLVSGVSRGSFRTSFLGTSGNDTVTAQGAFADQSYYMNGGMGNDTLTGSTVADFLVGGAGDDTLSGGSGNDQFLGGDGNDTVNGDGGDDIITGGLGNDVINGGLGNDTAIFNIATDGADSIDLGSGSDVVQLSGAGQIRLTLTTGEVGNGSVNDSNSLANQDGGLALRMQAEDGSDGLTGAISRSDDEGITLVAAAGTTFDVRDLPTGATRGDSFNVVMLGTSAASESLTASNILLSYYINGGNGRDIITGGAVADVLEGGADIDVIDGGEGDDVLLGGSGVDQLFGGIGNDRLDGGADNDFLTGGLGNDTYVTDGTDVITELAGEGIDEVIASLNYALSANVENLTLVGTAINGDGNELGNVITGNANANLLRGLDGNDLLIGGDGADNLQGNNGNDTLNGGEGDDVLDGGAAGDIMIGGNGNDIYTVDAVSDQVMETAGGGTNDRVISSVSYTLVGEIEVLNLVGAAALVGIGSATNNTINGNEFANTLYGNDGNDTLVGNAGDDTLYGGNGIDVLRGGDGNDVLDGGAGADSMSGGNGDDLYYIDSVADVIGESAGGGTNDRALVSVNNYVLAREVETATLTGTDNFALTGNVSANTLNGNSGNNLIRGGDGNDTILGNDGNDTLFGDAGADLLRGGNGTDILNGGLGSDQLQGGAGADIFRFTSVADLGLTGATTDRVLDFTAAQGDRIDLSAIDANVNVAGDQAFSFIGSAALSGTAGELRVQASGTNQLVYGDVNGDGIADFLIVVTPTGAVPLANGDFTL